MENIRHLLTAFLLMVSLSAIGQVEWPTPMPESKPGLRWWWPGSAVDDVNLKWNLEEYAKVGVGSVEITPIYGVQGNEQHAISFLSPEWMNQLARTHRRDKRHPRRHEYRYGMAVWRSFHAH